jgi:hypothetical protein
VRSENNNISSTLKKRSSLLHRNFENSEVVGLAPEVNHEVLIILNEPENRIFKKPLRIFKPSCFTQKPFHRNR